MKIRNGFVSNSSSSSFVIVGVKRKDEIMENENFSDNLISTLYIESSECDYITGIILSDDEYLEDFSLNFDKLQEYAERVSKALNVNINQVELIGGIRPS